MGRAFDATWDLVEKEGRTPRSAAYVVALRRIADAIGAQGDAAYFRGERS
jgi:glutamate dehydrogenase/leucine dehydrogenase